MTIYDIAAAALGVLFLAACLRGMRWASKPRPDRTDPPEEWLLSWLDEAGDVLPAADLTDLIQQTHDYAAAMAAVTEPSWLDLPHQSRHGAEIAELEAMWRR